jgi:hypothetical protein
MSRGSIGAILARGAVSGWRSGFRDLVWNPRRSIYSQGNDQSPKEDHVSNRKRIVERYIDGFRRSDHAQILSCLADDVVWALHGHKTLHGKDAFDA